ncbi:MAG: hypothetical protein QG588_2393, partial [Candidatus Poribacteria bacterium]|nr:hypothetical protein [Candidatus Poribacteria bacterium]
MRYVEVHGFKNGKPLPKWERIPETDIGRWIDEHEGLDRYLNTIQKFNLDIKQTQEEHECPFYLDFDSSLPEYSLNDARKFVTHIMELYGIENIHAWFSGNKGFHITIDQRIFGAVGDSKLTYHWRYLAEYFAKTLELNTLDKTVYTVPRMWRIENTINSKSGLYKIPLSLYELS